MVELTGPAQDDVEINVELTDIYESLDKPDMKKLFWWIIEDIWDEIKEDLKDWYEDDKDE